MNNTKTDNDYLGLIDYVSDHVLAFDAYPIEFECVGNDGKEGNVISFTDYIALLEKEAPSVVRLLDAYLAPRRPK